MNEAGFQAYIKACDFFIDGYDRMICDVRVLAAAARWAAANYAKAVAQFNATVADGDPEALIPNLLLMRDGVADAREAMVIARKNYRETEDAHTMTFAALNKGSSRTVTIRRVPVSWPFVALTFALTACTSQVGRQANPSSTAVDRIVRRARVRAPRSRQPLRWL